MPSSLSSCCNVSVARRALRRHRAVRAAHDWRSPPCRPPRRCSKAPAVARGSRCAANARQVRPALRALERDVARGHQPAGPSRIRHRLAVALRISPADPSARWRTMSIDARRVVRKRELRQHFAFTSLPRSTPCSDAEQRRSRVARHVDLLRLHVRHPGRHRVAPQKRARVSTRDGRGAFARRLQFRRVALPAQRVSRLRPGSPRPRRARGSRLRRRLSARLRGRVMRVCNSRMRTDSAAANSARARASCSARSRATRSATVSCWLLASSSRSWRSVSSSLRRSFSRRSSSSGTSAGMRMVPEPGAGSSRVVARSSSFEPRGRKRCAPTSAANASYFGPFDAERMQDRRAGA